ncbi:MAG TPA: glutamate-5-semialdehyde dehydrogenase [bacterium]
MGTPHAPESSGGTLDPQRFTRERALAARVAFGRTALCSTAQKNAALEAIAEELERSVEPILAANALDVQAGERAGIGPKLDRLLLNRERIAAICRDVRNVIALPDPVGEELSRSTRPNGLVVSRVRAPLGVVGIIYESRPNVTVDASVLCLKTGNTVVLKGGSDAIHSNRAVVAAIRRGLAASPLPPDAVQLLDSTDRAVTTAFLELQDVLDVIIPRGSLNLIRYARDHARVPVIETGASVVHAYVDEEVDLGEALELIVNAKVRRVSICGALDVLLLHRAVASSLLPRLAERLAAHEPPVELRADDAALAGLRDAYPAERLKALDPAQDYDTEWLDYVLAVHVVDSLDDALAHIATHSLKHTEAIYTTDRAKAERFLASVDSAVVMHNASTQFTDGAEFGLGAEIGISTQKLHVRGPFALEGLTSMKWLVRGAGQTRP